MPLYSQAVPLYYVAQKDKIFDLVFLRRYVITTYFRVPRRGNFRLSAASALATPENRPTAAALRQELFLAERDLINCMRFE
jgi:hypothetical protein